MSRAAIVFAEGYRGKRMETHKVGGAEFLVPGQYEAIYSEGGSGPIEITYANATGNAFMGVLVDGDTLAPLLMFKVDIYGARKFNPPTDFELSRCMLEAVTRLKTAVGVAS